MPFESSLKITSLKLPNFDGSILRRCRELRVLRMEGKRSDVALVSFEFVFGWFFEKVELL